MSVFFVPQVQQLFNTSPTITVTMAPKRFDSKETTESSTGEVIEHTLVDFPVYVDTQLFIENGSSLTWKQVKYAFAK